MKPLIILLLTTTTLFANAGIILKRHFGRLKQDGMISTCSVRNSTDRTLNLKYVVFHVEAFSGEDLGYDEQIRIDRIVKSGEAIRVSAEIPLTRRVTYCYFLAR